MQLRQQEAGQQRARLELEKRQRDELAQLTKEQEEQSRKPRKHHAQSNEFVPAYDNPAIPAHVREKEVQAIKSRHMGLESEGMRRKIRRHSDRKFLFDWAATD